MCRKAALQNLPAWADFIRKDFTHEVDFMKKATRKGGFFAQVIA